jgi:hypothetical protein
MQKLFLLKGNIWMMILNVAARMGNKGARQTKIFSKIAFRAGLRLLQSMGLPEIGRCVLCFLVYHSHLLH